MCVQCCTTRPLQVFFFLQTPASAAQVPNPTATYKILRQWVRASDSSLDWRYAFFFFNRFFPFVNDIHNFPLLLCLAINFLFVFNVYMQSCKCTQIHYYYNKVLCFVGSAIMFSVTGITCSSLRQFRRHTHTHTIVSQFLECHDIKNNECVLHNYNERT